MKIDSIIQLLLFTLLPTIMMRRAFKKMSEEERNQVKRELTKKSVLSTYGLMVLSILIILIERIFDIACLKIISGLLFTIGIVVHSIFTWLQVQSKIKALIGITLRIIGLIIYLWSLWKIY